MKEQLFRALRFVLSFFLRFFFVSFFAAVPVAIAFFGTDVVFSPAVAAALRTTDLRTSEEVSFMGAGGGGSEEDEAKPVAEDPPAAVFVLGAVLDASWWLYFMRR